MSKKLLIFDLDGTLINSIYAISNAVNKALRKLNLKEYDVNYYYNLVGNGLRALVDTIVENEEYDIKSDEILKYVLEIYNEEYGYMLDIYDGIDKLLSYLDKKEIKYAIITNKDENLAIKSCEVTSLKNFNFYKIIGVKPDKLERKKPNPKEVLDLISELNLSTKDVLFIGDMIVDLKTANNANVDFAYCKWGFGNIKGEKGIDDKYIVSDVYEIIYKYL